MGVVKGCFGARRVLLVGRRVNIKETVETSQGGTSMSGNEVGDENK